MPWELWSKDVLEVSGFECKVYTVYDDNTPINLEYELTPERLESWLRNEWYFIGLRVEISLDGIVLYRTGGLWGIESDSSPEYIKELALEEVSETLSSVKTILQNLVNTAATVHGITANVSPAAAALS